MKLHCWKCKQKIDHLVWCLQMCLWVKWLVAMCYKDEIVCLDLKSLILLYSLSCHKYHMSTYVCIGIQFKQLASRSLLVWEENFTLITDTHYLNDATHQKEHRDHCVSSGSLHGWRKCGETRKGCKCKELVHWVGTLTGKSLNNTEDQRTR